MLVALAFVMTLMTAVGASAQSASSCPSRTGSAGMKLKVQGVVSIRTGDSFKVRDPGGAETSVLLTASTDVTSHSRGLQRQKGLPGDLHHARSACASPGKGRCRR